MEEWAMNYCGFRTKEELMSHMESVLSCLKEYEGTNCVVEYHPIISSKGRKDVFFVKKKGRQFSSWCSSLEEAADKFLEYQGGTNESPDSICKQQ